MPNYAIKVVLRKVLKFFLFIEKVIHIFTTNSVIMCVTVAKDTASLINLVK